MNLILGIALLICGGLQFFFLAAAVIGGSTRGASVTAVFLMLNYGIWGIWGGIALLGAR